MRSFTRSPRPARLLLGVLAGLVLAGPGSLAAQLGAGVRPAKLEPTTTSEAAKTAFWTAIDHFNNIEFAPGAVHMKRALELDPGFGLARVAYGLNAPGLTAAERDSTIARGVADAARGAPLEALVAMGMREFRGDRERGRTILKSAAAIAPGDPNIAFYVAQLSTNAGETAIAMRDVTARFPDFAPAYNLLAYNLWTIRDRAGALEAAANYMAKAPNHPNSHDTYAEILQFSGRFDEAIAHYKKAMEMDPTNTEGAVGMAEVYTLQGKAVEARTAIMGVMDRVTVPVTRVNYLRAIAATYLLENNVKQAIAQLGTSAEEAKKAGLPAPEAQAHLVMATTDATFGDGKSVAAHVTAGSTAGDEGFRHYVVAWSHAFARQPEVARRELEAIAQSSATPAVKATWTAHVNAILLINENKPAEAVTVLQQAAPGQPLTRALMALALHKAGQIGAARSLRDEILSNRQINLANWNDVSARQMVKRIN